MASARVAAPSFRALSRGCALALAVALIAPAARSNAAPDDNNLAERRAVRGVPVDEIDANETPELREIRRFEEAAFPRPGSAKPTGTEAPLPPPSLPGAWGGSGDVPPELRSPGPRERVEATSPDSDWLRRLKLPDLPIRWDPQVLRYLDYFKNDPKGHAIMANWLRRAGRYRELFEQVLGRQGLPRDLLYVAMIESGFGTSAKSRVGAGGIWQFMPGAARAYGLEVSYWTDARRDPERAVEAGARYLKDLYVRFGSWYLVFAAYNAGYGAVLRSITNYNTNDYWELIRHESGLPWESSLYVPKILAAAIVGNNQAAFGFTDVACDAPFAYEEVEVPAGTALATVARSAGTKPEVIEALNPQLVRARTPPDRGVSRVRIPPGTSALYAANAEKAKAEATRLDTVVLRFGETLDDVARARNLNVRELRRLNGVKDSAELRAGMPIVVPKRGAAAKDDAATALASAAPDKDKDKGGDGGEVTETILVAVPDRAFGFEGRERVFYRTRDGDEIEEIADAFGVRGEDLVEWNNIDPSAKLHPKMVLQIFVRKDFDPAGIVLLDSTKVRVVTLGSEEFLELETARRGKKRLVYTAKPGDTLAKLGRRYGLSPGDLARINRFSYNTELHEGDKVIVYSPTGEAPREVTMGLTPSTKRTDRGTTAPRSPTEARAKGKPPAPIKTATAPKPKPTSTSTGKATVPPGGDKKKTASSAAPARAAEKADKAAPKKK